MPPLAIVYQPYSSISLLLRLCSSSVNFPLHLLLHFDFICPSPLPSAQTLLLPVIPTELFSHRGLARLGSASPIPCLSCPSSAPLSPQTFFILQPELLKHPGYKLSHSCKAPLWLKQAILTVNRFIVAFHQICQC